MQSSGFVLNEAAQYAFECQDVYPDIVSFAAAIPEQLKHIFLIPIKAELAVASTTAEIARKIALETSLDGSTPEGDLFSYSTFKYEDNEPNKPSSEPGSIFRMDTPIDKTHHQEYNFDQNIQAPTDTSFMSDVDITQYVKYPYRTDENVKTSSSNSFPIITRFAISEKYLLTKTPEKIKDNAEKCNVKLLTYDSPTKTFTFSVTGNTSPRTVLTSLVDAENVAVSCDCEFWRWNGPEHHAVNNAYMLGIPYGSAANPTERDPDKKYWLCKHAYAVLKRFDDWVDQIYEEMVPESDDELLSALDENWDRLEEVTEVPLDDIEDDDVDLDWDEVQVSWEESSDQQEVQTQVSDEDIQYLDEQVQVSDEDIQVLEQRK